jgi:GNAT superfamily N-acetyltransferase
MDAVNKPAGLVLRPAVEADVPLLLALIRELAAYENLGHEVACDESRLREHLFGSRPCAEALLGFVDGAPAAFAVFFHNFSTFVGRPGLYLEDLFVRPEFRRRGIARSLLRHLARLAVERGCGRFEWTVLDWNRSAIEFYETLGARVLPDWRVCRVTGRALERLGGEASPRERDEQARDAR